MARSHGHGRSTVAEAIANSATFGVAAPDDAGAAEMMGAS